MPGRKDSVDVLVATRLLVVGRPEPEEVRLIGSKDCVADVESGREAPPSMLYYRETPRYQSIYSRVRKAKQQLCTELKVKTS